MTLKNNRFLSTLRSPPWGSNFDLKNSSTRGSKNDPQNDPEKSLFLVLNKIQNFDVRNEYEYSIFLRNVSISVPFVIKFGGEEVERDLIGDPTINVKSICGLANLKDLGDEINLNISDLVTIIHLKDVIPTESNLVILVVL
jgi:hypothetical protein|nr:MAG TPA: hypothetical protein [Caudoviricetes sp.]